MLYGPAPSFDLGSSSLLLLGWFMQNNNNIIYYLFGDCFRAVLPSVWTEAKRTERPSPLMLWWSAAHNVLWSIIIYIYIKRIVITPKVSASQCRNRLQCYVPLHGLAWHRISLFRLIASSLKSWTRQALSSSTDHHDESSHCRAVWGRFAECDSLLLRRQTTMMA